MVDPLHRDDPQQIGPYRILGRLGAGGMGQVFLGQDGSGAPAAVKTLHIGGAYDTDLINRFQREVELIGKIRPEHARHTARLLDADPKARPPWLATEYLPGLTLAELFPLIGAAPEDLVRRLGAELADGLAAIHAARVVHRDLKPSNVLVLAGGVRIIDFGISLTVLPEDASRLTVPGFLHGTVGFMAPERFAGAPGTPASDMFALAAILVYTATGRLPFEGPSLERYFYAVNHTPPNLAGVPDGMAWTLRRCLEPAPGDRPSARQVGDRLATGLPPGFTESWLPPDALTAIAAHRAAVEALIRPTPSPPTQVRTWVGQLEPSARINPEISGCDDEVDLPRSGLGWAAGWRPWRATRAAMARAETVVGGGAVVVSADDGLHVHERRDGGVRWRHPGAPGHGYRPVIAGDVLVVPGGSAVAALELSTGVPRWELPATPHCEPLFAHGLVHIVGPGKRNLYAVGADTGEVLWRTTAEGVRPVPTAPGVVFAQGRTLRERQHTGDWRWQYGDLPAPVSGLTAAGDLVLVRMADQLLALDVHTGRARWQHGGLPYRVVPSASADVVVLPVEGELLGLDPADGAVRWRWAGTGTPHATAGGVFVVEPSGLTALDGDGRVQWRIPGNAMWPDLRVTPDLVYVIDAGALHAHPRHDGVKGWSATDIVALRAPVVADGVVYLENGYTLFAINADDGERLPT